MLRANIEAQQLASEGERLYSEVVQDVRAGRTVLTQEQMQVLNNLRNQIAECKKLGIV
jgi:hypothetical protein